MLLRKQAEEIVSLVEKTKAEVSASKQHITGDIHIGGGETESMRPIAQAVEQVQQRHPGICVHFFSGDGYDVAERLDQASLILAPSLSRWRWASMTPSVCRARMCGGSSSAGTILWPGRRWFGRRIWRTPPYCLPADGGRKRPVRLAGMTMRNCTSSPPKPGEQPDPIGGRRGGLCAYPGWGGEGGGDRLCFPPLAPGWNRGCAWYGRIARFFPRRRRLFAPGTGESIRRPPITGKRSGKNHRFTKL